jgi:adenylylsulfate kinase
MEWSHELPRRSCSIKKVSLSGSQVISSLDDLFGQNRSREICLRIRRRSSLVFFYLKSQLIIAGLSGSGKSTVACTLEHALAERGKMTVLLDGDNVRHGLNSNLGFTAMDREENIRRIGEVAKLFAESGVITLTSFISPYREDRARVRSRLAAEDFVEVYMRIPIELCEQRDPKGLYKAARAGKIKNFTGIDDPYEEPESAELIIDAKDASGKMASAEDMASQILEYLSQRGYLTGPKPQ